ncbi:hypothetical protein BC830DRAFT_1169882 [Chytriomyces sp. MP71]|nr:hypothetical protein BC830DRAFT_1169882 [Chytriomyces sp. MP71]
MQTSQQRRVVSVHSETAPVSDAETRLSRDGRSLASTPSVANLLQIAPTQLASAAIVVGAFDDADEDAEAIKTNLTQDWQPQSVWTEYKNDCIPTSAAVDAVTETYGEPQQRNCCQ